MGLFLSRSFGTPAHVLHQFLCSIRKPFLRPDPRFVAGFDELESRRAPGLQQFHGTKSSGLDIMRALVHVGECE
jgi:hypothetical protein